MAMKSIPTYPMNFRLEKQYRDMIEEVGVSYGTRSMTEVLKRMIQKEYQAQIINPQQNTKEGNLT